MTKIEQLNKDNVDIVHHLANEIWPHTFKEILSEDQIRYMLDWMYDIGTLRDQVQVGHLYYVIKEYNAPKGFIGLEPNYPDAGHLRIHKLYVLPETQGSGLGRELVNHAIDIAFDLDLDSLHLNVNKYNKSVDFYKHVGFNVIGEEDIDIGKGYLMEDFIMNLQLRSK